jgi:hypothetical protein
MKETPKKNSMSKLPGASKEFAAENEQMSTFPKSKVPVSASNQQETSMQNLNMIRFLPTLPTPRVPSKGHYRLSRRATKPKFKWMVSCYTSSANSSARSK